LAIVKKAVKKYQFRIQKNRGKFAESGSLQSMMKNMMKKLIFITIFGLILLFLVVTPSGAASLPQRLSGKVLLQVEKNGEAWYIYPDNLKRYYLGRPQDAFDVMRNLGLGISNTDLSKIPAKDDLFVGDVKLCNRLKGKILLQVEGYGEAWYVYPNDLKRYYLGRPQDAFRIMKKLSLGITNTDLDEVQIAPAEASTKEKKINFRCPQCLPNYYFY